MLYECVSCGEKIRQDPSEPRPSGWAPVWRDYDDGRHSFVVRWECGACHGSVTDNHEQGEPLRAISLFG